MPPSVLERMLTMQDIIEVTSYLNDRDKETKEPTPDEVLRKYLEDTKTAQ